MNKNELLQILRDLRQKCPEVLTTGISEEDISYFLEVDVRLEQAIFQACQTFVSLEKEYPDFLKLSEKDLIKKIQEGYCNFYGYEAVKPYVPLAAAGPWMVTTAGAVVYDVGSYGMLSLGHSAPFLKEAIKKDVVMANVMTANFSQRRLMERLRREIGQNRLGCPYDKFICLNSGSEVVTLALTLSDVNAKIQTDPGARHAGKKIVFMALEGSFHGRTGRAARMSDSTAKYHQCLASFRDEHRLITVPPNDCFALEKIFKKVESENMFIDAFFMEPVMGEGNPGKAINPHFYRLARRLTREYDSILVVDSIQATFRTYGYMSVVDYPGFEKLDAPDMETFAKSINGGEFPISLLAMTERASRLYKPGIYGNTMTTNPRGLNVISAVMDAMTPELRLNIRARGEELLDGFLQLEKEFPHLIRSVQGAGLLLSMALNPDEFQVEGKKGIENYMRRNGINVIHGGKNALRFTPNLGITSEEVHLLLRQIRHTLQFAPRRTKEDCPILNIKGNQELRKTA